MARVPYPRYLPDAQWHLLEPLLPALSKGGRPREVRSLAGRNARFYLLRSGGAWRMLPHGFCPWQPGYSYFRRGQDDGTWERPDEALRTRVRLAQGCQAHPSAALLESQPGKTPEVPGERGDDAGERGNGRNRRILVDTLGRAPTGAYGVPKGRVRGLSASGADGISGGVLGAWVLTHCGWGRELVPRNADVKGVQILPKRWIVERTFPGLGGSRRLSKDSAGNPQTSQACILAAMAHLMIRHLAAKQLENKFQPPSKRRL